VRQAHFSKILKCSITFSFVRRILNLINYNEEISDCPHAVLPRATSVRQAVGTKAAKLNITAHSKRCGALKASCIRFPESSECGAKFSFGVAGLGANFQAPKPAAACASADSGARCTLSSLDPDVRARNAQREFRHDMLDFQCAASGDSCE
jgi:hypothetical protein